MANLGIHFYLYKEPYYLYKEVRIGFATNFDFRFSTDSYLLEGHGRV